MRDLATVGIRLLGLFYVTTSLVTFVGGLVQRGADWYYPPTASSAAMICLGCLLVLAARPLAGLVARETESTADDQRWGRLEEAAFAAVGLYLFASSAEWAVSVGYAATSAISRGEDAAGQYTAQVISTTVRGVIGLTLLFGARGLVGLLRLVRRIGMKEPR